MSNEDDEHDDAAAAAADNNDWVYPTNENYQPYIVELMEFFHGGVDYPADKTFTREELLELEPMIIKRWLANKAYGDPEYNLDNQGDCPIHVRSNTLEFAKKAVSFFMPNRTPAWVDGVGNPTKSKLINNLLKEVKALESRQEAVMDKSMRPLTEAEFRRTLQLFHAQKDWRTKFKFTTMLVMQYHLMARMDDVAHLETSHLQSHTNFDFCLQTRIRKSQHASNEQEPEFFPDQILLGSIDSLSCVITHLGLYLETFLANARQSKYLFTSSATQITPKNLMQIYRTRLDSVVLQSPMFRALAPSGDPRRIGAPSYIKFPFQHAIEKGAPPEDVHIRGRSKKRAARRIGLTNPRNNDPPTIDPCKDAKVASLLCVGGPIKYKLRPDIVITDEWLFENIVPNIHRRYADDPNMCKTLALSILCVALEGGSTSSIPVPQEIRERVRQAYAGLGLDETHPVMKIPLHVYRRDEQLMIQEAIPTSATTAMQGSIPIQAILMRLDRLERTTTEYQRQHQESIQRMEQVLVTHLSTINSSICRIGGAVLDALARQPEPPNQQPVVQPATRTTGNPRRSQQQIQCQDLPALLSKNPKSLLDLWKEYKQGINGRKPAEQFTTHERNSRLGGIKQKYYRRRVVWDCMERLVQRGFSPPAAANKILDVYGRDQSVTQIINLMIRDKQTGGHPNLR